MGKEKAPRNRTITLNNDEVDLYSAKLLYLKNKTEFSQIKNKTINQDLFDVIDLLPENFADLMFLDPPYNLNRKFNSAEFKSMPIEAYTEYIDTFLSKLIKTLKPNASVYFCGDFRSSTSIHLLLEKYFIVRNRITWEREKGRGAKYNWKNSSEDIWFATRSGKYTFNVEDVKLKRKVIAPYKENGKPKDWAEEESGGFRLTYPSNIWTDISIPFWSMPENTEHPTQKPEKLLAKLILASSNPGDVIFDPFLGSGTTSVTAKKLSRNYVGIEKENIFACLAEKRIAESEQNLSIQGYEDGVFWERNTFGERQRKIKTGNQV